MTRSNFSAQCATAWADTAFGTDTNSTGLGYTLGYRGIPQSSGAIDGHRAGVCITERALILILGSKRLDYAEPYKYPGVYINEFLNYDYPAEQLAYSGKRALGSVIQKYKTYPNMCYSTYTKLFNTLCCSSD